MQPGWTRTYVKVARRPIIDEPYNPDAKDGDGDGIVQEWTAWERPAGTFFVDLDNSPFKAGLRRPDRPKEGTFRLVDANGKEVDYTPTYRRTDSGTVGQTIGESLGAIEEPKTPTKKPESQPQPTRTPLQTDDVISTEGLDVDEDDEDPNAKLTYGFDDVLIENSKKKVDDSFFEFEVTGHEGTSSQKTTKSIGRFIYGQRLQETRAKLAKALSSRIVGQRMIENGVNFKAIKERFMDNVSVYITDDGIILLDDGFEYPTAFRVDEEDSLYETLLADAVVSWLIQQWTVGSDMTKSEDQRRLQNAATKIFNLESNLLETPENKELDELFEQFLQAMYEQTQEMFLEEGITEIVLHRGMGIAPINPINEVENNNILGRLVRAFMVAWGRLGSQSSWRDMRDVTEDVSIELRPLSSFSVSKGTAEDFSYSQEMVRVLMSAKVPVSRVISSPGTGLGCLAEGELVVLGKSKGASDDDVFETLFNAGHLALLLPMRDRNLWKQLFRKLATIYPTIRMPRELK